MELSSFYRAWKAQDTGGYEFTVDVPGSETRAPGIHASELSCQLKLVYNLMGVEKRPETGNIGMQMRFNAGHAIHGLLQTQFHLMAKWFNGPILFEDEVGIHPDIGGVAATYTMYSSCDGVFTFVHDGVAYLRIGLEIKTESDKQFDKLAKPRDYHMEQVNMYMKALDLPLMWLLYYNKSNSVFTPSSPPWLFQFDDNLWTKTVEPKVAGAHRHVRAGTFPPRSEGFYCQWCPFAYTCKPKQAQSRYGPSGTVPQPGAMR